MKRLQAKGLAIQWGGDFGGPDETALSEEFDRPLMVHRYPSAVKAFYMKPDPDRPELALGVDVLAPEGYGEIIGGGERLADLDLLLQRIKEHQLPQEAFEWYLDLRRYGTVPHGGFGMGIERVVSWICKLEHVRETIPYPRNAQSDSIHEDRSYLPGCPKNLVDSEVMLGLAREAGHELTKDAAGADVLVVNTCAFIDSAKQESIDAILEMAGHKKDGACKRLIVTGCLGERYRDELKKEIPEIDAVLGTGEVPAIVGAITEPCRHCATRNVAVESSSSTSARRTEHPATVQNPEPGTRNPAPATQHGTCPTTCTMPTPRECLPRRATTRIKVAEGCDYKCAFCIIPTCCAAITGAVRRNHSCAKRACSRVRASRNCC